MPDRIRTPTDVCDVLAELCRGRAGAHVATGGAIEQQLNWRRRFLADDRDGWDALLMRAQCAAAGESVRARYGALGWPRRRFDRAWARAAAAIAAGLANERVNAAAFAANEAAEARLERLGKIQSGPAARSLLTPYKPEPDA